MRSPGIDLSTATWRTSSYSNQDGGACVEVAYGVPGVVPVRDSKNPVPALAVAPDAWRAFVGQVKG